MIRVENSLCQNLFRMNGMCTAMKDMHKPLILSACYTFSVNDFFGFGFAEP